MARLLAICALLSAAVIGLGSNASAQSGRKISIENCHQCIDKSCRPIDNLKEIEVDARTVLLVLNSDGMQRLLRYPTENWSCVIAPSRGFAFDCSRGASSAISFDGKRRYVSRTVIVDEVISTTCDAR